MQRRGDGIIPPEVLEHGRADRLQRHQAALHYRQYARNTPIGRDGKERKNAFQHMLLSASPSGPPPSLTVVAERNSRSRSKLSPGLMVAPGGCTPEWSSGSRPPTPGLA
jgi:hypothetical protein